MIESNANENETQGRTWDSFPDMLEDIWAHRKESGQDVEVFDDPMARQLGYKTATRWWRITLTNARHPINNDPRGARRRFLGEMLMSAETKLKLGNLGAFPKEALPVV
jgi:hypothetical protein